MTQSQEDRIAALEAALVRQQNEIAALRAASAHRPEAGEPLSRRDMLRRAAFVSGAALAAGAAGLAAAGPAAADDGDPIKAGQQTNEATGTVVFITADVTAHGGLTVTDTSFAALQQRPLPAAVVGIGESTFAGGVGVSGAGSQVGVYGAGGSFGVIGTAAGTHSVGLRGDGATGVTADGTKVGVQAKGGAFGVNASGAVGVNASGARGAVLHGTSAPLQLATGTGTSHPHSGHAGDLYVDKSHRLWFCKGTTHWVQLG